jgi:hypothetical protein
MPTRKHSGLRVGFSLIVATMLLLALVSGLTSCASHCPDKAVKAKIPARNGINAPDCACTLEHRMNLCVTLNGSDSLPPGSSFVRQHEDGWRDSIDQVSVSLNPGGPQCFGEARGVQRILLRKNKVVLDSTGWFEIPTVDCCHGAAKTVDFHRN